MAEKNGYEHFMLKEIFEQPEAVHNTIGEWIDHPERLLEELNLNLKMTIGLGRLDIIACGTSYHAALVAQYMIRNLARIPVHVEIASEYRYSNPIIDKGNLFISITQSGETADTLAAQREAKSKNAKTLTICNVVGSTAAREADSVLYTRAGLEMGVASTKAFTSQVAALCLIAIGLSIKRGMMSVLETKGLRSQLAKIPELIDKALLKTEKIKELAEYPVARKGLHVSWQGDTFSHSHRRSSQTEGNCIYPCRGLSCRGNEARTYRTDRRRNTGNRDCPNERTFRKDTLQYRRS